MPTSAPVVDRIRKRLSGLVRWQPLQAEVEAPLLSLTAHDGTWIRLPDYREHGNVLLVFFSEATSPAAGSYLRSIESQRADFLGLSTTVIGVNSARPPRLREIRENLGLEFALAYDPFGLDSRAFHLSGRLIPKVRDGVVLVDRQGKVRWSAAGRPNVGEIYDQVAAVSGASRAAETGGPTVKEIDSAQAVALLSDRHAGWLLLDVRTLSEFEADHAPDAAHIPLDELPARWSDLHHPERILTICQAGGRSAAAAEFLVSVGVREVMSVRGGMSAWGGPRLTGGKA
jgi:rhodanese-related sulfurtransferase/peroxiredoxin